MIVAHPDDETLGCGGTIRKNVEYGNEVFVLVLSNGVGSRDSGVIDSDEIKRRSQNLDEACAILGVSQYRLLNFPDNKFDSVPLLDIVQSIEAFKKEFGFFDRVYTHFWGDLNLDHALTCKAVNIAFRPCSGSDVSEILCFEILSSTEWGYESEWFRPSVFVDIENQLENKIKAIKCYDTELRTFPHPRSVAAIEALARTRGSVVGYGAAEAFVPIRLFG